MVQTELERGPMRTARMHVGTTTPGVVPSAAPPRLRCSVGIMAYNEEGNIANAIRSALGQPTEKAEIVEVIVIASGCTDRTPAIVASLARSEPRLRLIVEEQRAGKASAINHFIDTANSPVLVLVNADTIVQPGAFDALVTHFHDPGVGMVGGHPVPLNDDETFLGYAVHLLWRLHDQIARETPKLGEIVAFRNVLPRIPVDTAVDEMSIQAMMTRLGYRLVYEPEAVVFNRGPATVSDFICQRRRISAGHFRIARDERCAAPTMSTRRVGRAVLATECFRRGGAPWWTLGAATLEVTARALGYYDVLRNRPHHIWAAIATTKGDLVGGGSVGRAENVLVFHVVDISAPASEASTRAASDAHRRVVEQLEACLEPGAIVSGVDDATVVVLLPGDREVAERAARQLVEELAATPLGSAVFDLDDLVERPVAVDCVVISFPPHGLPFADALPTALSAEVCAS